MPPFYGYSIVGFYLIGMRIHPVEFFQKIPQPAFKVDLAISYGRLLSKIGIEAKRKKHFLIIEIQRLV